MSRKTLISAIILSSLVFLTIWVFFSDSSGRLKLGKREENLQNAQQESEKVQVNDIVVIETKEGEKYWELCADKGSYVNSEGRLLLENVTTNFYKEKEVVLSLHAPIAEYDSAKKSVTLKNGSRAANNNGASVIAREINWEGESGVITASGKVKIAQTDKMLTTSDKAIFNADFTNLKLVGNSHSYVYR